MGSGVILNQCAWGLASAKAPAKLAEAPSARRRATPMRGGSTRRDRSPRPLALPPGAYFVDDFVRSELIRWGERHAADYIQVHPVHPVHPVHLVHLVQ